MIVINILGHVQLAVVSGDQSSFAVPTSLLRTHPVLAFVALFGANVAEAVVENLRSASLTGHKGVLLLVAVLSGWQDGPVNFLAAGT